MAVFANCFVVLDLKDLPFKEKKRVRLAITDNGGTISYVVNKQCSFVVVSCLGNLSSNRQRSARKLQVPVVGLAYLWACLEKSTLLPPAEHTLLPLTTAEDPAPSSTSRPEKQVASEERRADKQSKDPPQRQTEEKQAKNKNDANYICNHRIYSENDQDLPEFPSHFQVAKYCVFASADATDDSGDWCLVELQSAAGEKRRVFQVVRYMKKQAQVVRDQLVWCGCSEDALEVYQAMQQRLTDAQYQPRKKLPAPHRDLGSPTLGQLLLEEDLHCGSLSQEVGVFVELVWTEALGSLTSHL
ncbi:protein mono-ADP-ribosyltransferase PARP4-like [Engraulis encrasicolus]|uniref:protein mono-ADP-ribosyltransferase PARP4-like n=1 Tax=Engraulis encrasicolus TaxID=184585 RepID=UPI002FD06BE9